MFARMGGAGWGVALLVGAGAVAEVVAKACSSPQTTELNADTRAPTLMKWVHIGMGEAFVIVAAAALFDPQYRTPILIGGAMEGAITYAQYLHAKQSGLASSAPGTETGAQVPAGARRGAPAWGWA